MAKAGGNGFTRAQSGHVKESELVFRANDRCLILSTFAESIHFVGQNRKSVVVFCQNFFFYFYFIRNYYKLLLCVTFSYNTFDNL